MDQTSRISTPSEHPLSGATSDSSGPDLLAGRYRLGGLLGRGGMADVYQATDELLTRSVAIKVFRPDSGMPHQDLRQRNEIRTLARLSHPGLVTLYDAGTDPPDAADGRAYLVMELVPGAS